MEAKSTTGLFKVRNFPKSKITRNLVMRLFKTGKLNKFKRTPDGRARTRIFVECQNCPNLKRYQYYLIAGSELRRTHFLGNDPFYNGVVNSNDLVVKV